LKAQYDAGADPLVVLTDMAEFIHLVTRTKVVETSLENPSLTENERSAAKGFAAKLDMATLARAWQMLSKGLHEVEGAARPLAAADMVLVRLAYTANLPTPGDIIKRLEDGDHSASPAADKVAPVPTPIRAHPPMRPLWKTKSVLKPANPPRRRRPHGRMRRTRRTSPRPPPLSAILIYGWPIWSKPRCGR